ncbi:hypothetical protein ACOME3_007393 [Neoechinorhynchus agilis]
MKVKYGANLKSEWVGACLDWYTNENSNVILREFKEEAYKQYLGSSLKITSLPAINIKDLLENCSVLERCRNAVEVIDCIDISRSIYSQFVEYSETSDGNRYETIFDDAVDSCITETQCEIQLQKSTTKRVLFLTLTDGYCQFKEKICVHQKGGFEFPLEHKPWASSFPFDIVPVGLKVLLRGTIQMRLGCLLLSEENVHVLGCSGTNRLPDYGNFLLQRLLSNAKLKQRVQRLIEKEKSINIVQTSNVAVQLNNDDGYEDDDDDELLAMVAAQSEQNLRNEEAKKEVVLIDGSYLAMEGKCTDNGSARWIVRAFIASITKKLSVCPHAKEWTMECVINDGSKCQEVKVSHNLKAFVPFLLPCTKCKY